MKKGLIVGGAIVVLLFVAFYLKDYRGIWPLLQAPPDRNITAEENGTPEAPGTNTTGMPLSLSPGFSISIFAEDLPGARVMVFDPLGAMWVSQTDQGTVSLLEIRDGAVTNQNAVLRNLNNPHGLAFGLGDNPFRLYVAEEHRVSYIATYSEGGMKKIADLPGGGGHKTRTLGFGPDQRLYISIGSSCNVCIEEDNRRAKIFTMDAEGGNFKEFARGLRNAVFFDWHPETKELWTTEMGRDMLGDDIPPEEINIVKEGGDYGWPTCYGKNVHDGQFDRGGNCDGKTGSHVDMQAHSAPLGMAFVPESWPEEYRDDLLVAFHGSWNRSEPTGYKIVRLKFAEDGKFEGIEDFISGWRSSQGVYGRPAGLTFDNEGNLYISDDRAGLIYKVSLQK